MGLSLKSNYSGVQHGSRLAATLLCLQQSLVPSVFFTLTRNSATRHFRTDTFLLHRNLRYL